MTFLQKGFTLVEIIIVIGIIAIVVGGSIRVYSITFAERQLDKEADALVNVLQRSKDRTVARDISPIPPTPGCLLFEGYGLLVNSDGTYEEQVMCDATTTTLNQYSLDNMVFNGLSPSPMQLTFTYPYGSLSTTTRIIQIQNSRLNRCIDITIPQLGPIHKSDMNSC